MGRYFNFFLRSSLTMSGKNSVMAKAAFFMKEQNKIKESSFSRTRFRRSQRKQRTNSEKSDSSELGSPFKNLKEKDIFPNSVSPHVKEEKEIKRNAVNASRNFFMKEQMKAKKTVASHEKADYKKGSIKDRLAMFQNIDKTSIAAKREKQKEWKRAAKRRERAQTKAAEFARKQEQLNP